MAGIGFELRRAIRSGRPSQKANGYFSAAFTCFGGMLIGIILLVLLQTAAGVTGLSRQTSDLFMSYVTNAMFLSMLTTSCLSLISSRYMSDLLYTGRHEEIMPAVTGSILCSLVLGGVIMGVIIAVSGLPLRERILLMLLFGTLSLCWGLMNSISLLRDYRQITWAFLVALCVSCVLVLALGLLKQISLYTMLLVLIAAYTAVDAWLFRAMYRSFPLSQGSVFAFLSYLRKVPALAISGLMLETGLLGHFWLTWFTAPEGRIMDGLFACSPAYDFPAIVAYFSTIPAMIYFITIFETGFCEKYHAYLDALNHLGTEAVDTARGGMIASIRRGLSGFCSIQIVSCLLFITVGSKLLGVMNIGMTERMLQTFRLFCVGYSLFAIGNILLLLQMYFINERSCALVSCLFALTVLGGSLLGIRMTGTASGIGFGLGTLVLVCISGIQLVRCLGHLEYHIFSRSLLEDNRPASASLRHATSRSPRQCRDLIIAGMAVCLAMMVGSASVMGRDAMRSRKILTFTPEQSSAVLLSPGMGFAPWANSDEGEEMQSTLIYVELRWADWEPQEGVYDVDFVNDEYRLETYREQGRQVVFRFICDEPTDEEHIDIPDWLYLATGDGQHYETTYGKGYSPNYSNEAFIQAHSRAVAALGEAFGSGTFFRYVQLGSLGHWGEYHVNLSEGLSPLPYYDTRVEYIRPYIAAFPNAHFMTRYPLLETVKFGCGLYNDMTGEADETEYWLAQMHGGIWEQTGLPEQAECSNAWQTAPIAGEFSSASNDSFYLHDNLSVTLELLRSSHQSIIGPKIIVNEADVDYSFAAGEILRTIGYRYTVSGVTLDLSDDSAIHAQVTMENLGVAPIYDQYSVILSLWDADDNDVWSSELQGADLTALLPGTPHTAFADIPRDELDDDMRYTLTLSIVNAMGEPYIPMALQQELHTMEYVIASFMLGQ